MAPPWSEAWVSVWPASNHPLSWPPSVRLTLDDIQRKFPPKQPIRLTERPAGS